MEDAQKKEATASVKPEQQAAKGNIDDLKALTNQPIKIKIGEGEFNLRRVTLKDTLAFEDKREEFVKEGFSTGRVGIFSLLFLLSILLQPAINYTVDQLQEMVLLEDMDYVMAKLKEAGFKAPQTVNQEAVKQEEKLPEVKK